MPTAAAPNLGIVGAGRLARFLVRGLRHAGDDRPVLLSPRGAATAAELAAECGCTIAADNQAVVDGSEVTIIAVPPPQALATIAALRWPAGRLLVCVALDVDLPALTAAAPGARIVRAMPTAASEVGLGSTPILPPDAEAEALFGRVGDVHPCRDAAGFAVATALTVHHLWLFGLMEALAETAVAAGLERREAVRLVAGLTRSAGAFALAADPAATMRAPLDTQGVAGTMTAAGFAEIERRGGLAAWTAGLETAIRRARHGA